MVRPIKISVVADADRARKELGSLGSTLKRTLGAGAAILAGAGIAEGLRSIVTAGSEAQQSLGATEAIFGKYAGTVTKRSEEAAESVGLSANAYRESSNLLGALFKNQGVELDKLSSKTDDHLKLAADLAAMYGGTVTESVDALTAAYKGEFNQLERYGVTLKQDTINTEANVIAKKRFGDELKNLGPKQQSIAKQLATQALLFRQTADAAGTFAKESDTLAGQQQRLTAELDNAKAEIGQALLPMLTDLASWVRAEVVPALEDFARWMSENSDEIQAAARELGGRLLPILETAGDVIGAVVGIVKEMPEPLRGIAVQAALAAAVLPKLSAAATVASGRLAAMGASARTSAGRMTLLGGAIRNLAGVAGLVLLARSVNETSDSLKVLERVAGGALTGLQMGGIVGAVAGGVLGLASAYDELKSSISRAILGESEWNSSAEVVNAQIQNKVEGIARYKARVDALKASLDAFTAAQTGETRVKALDALEKQLPGVTAAMKTAGISQRTLAKAATGNAEALGKINAVYENATPFQKFTFSQHQVSDALDAVGVSFNQASREAREQILVSQDLKALYGKLPKNVYTKLEATGIEPTIRGVAKVAAKYNLTPKQIKSVISVLGVDATVKQVQRAKGRIEDLGNADPKLDKKLPPKVKRGIDATKNPTLAALERAVNTPLRDVGKNVQPNLNPFGRSLSGKITALQGPASRDGSGVGRNLGAGMYGGLGEWIDPIASRAASMVRGAVSAANAAGAVRSPSRETEYTGRMLGRGLERGLDRSRPRVRVMGAALVRSVLAGVQGGSTGAANALDAITSQIRRGITGKGDAAREAALLKRLRARYAAIRRNAKAQDANTAALERARQKLADLKQEAADYAATIKSSITSYGDVTQLGRQDDGTVSTTTLLREMQQRVLNAERFRILIQQLAKEGLSRASVQQLLDAGPEAALATAEAIRAGGASAITELNTLQTRLATAGAGLGDAMSDRYYSAGVQAAAGLVRGLEAQARNLDRAAVRLANELVRAVKRALGIRSPSRVFAGIGENVTKGLDLGLDETYVKRSGAQLASSLEQGFGTPALAAYASITAGGSSSPTIRLRLSAEQISQLQRGREIQADLDYARSNGVRGVTF